MKRTESSRAKREARARGRGTSLTRHPERRRGISHILALPSLLLFLLAACDEETTAVDTTITNPMHCGATTWSITIDGATNPDMYVAQNDCFLVELRDDDDNVLEMTEDVRPGIQVRVYIPIYDDSGQTLIGECFIEGLDEDGGNLEVSLGGDAGYCAWEPDESGTGLANRRWTITGGTVSNRWVRDLGTTVWSIRAEADVAVYLFEGDDTSNTFGTLSLGTGQINYDGLPTEADISWPTANEVESVCAVDGCYDVSYTGAVADGGIDTEACQADLENFGAEQSLTYDVVRDGAISDDGDRLFQFHRIYDTCRFISRDGNEWLHVLDYDTGEAFVTYQSIAGGRVCEIEYTGTLAEASCN